MNTIKLIFLKYKPFSRITNIFFKILEGKYFCVGIISSTDQFKSMQENIFMKFVNNLSFRSTKIHIRRSRIWSHSRSWCMFLCWKSCSGGHYGKQQYLLFTMSVPIYLIMFNPKTSNTFKDKKTYFIISNYH